MDAVTHSLDQIACDLARLEGKDHVGRHGVVLENGMGHAVLDQLLVEDSRLDSDRKSVQILDLVVGTGLCRCGCGRILGTENYKKDRTCVVDVRKRSGLVALFAYNDVHSDIELSGLDTRCDGLERNLIEDRCVAVLHAETADELDIETCEVAVAYEAERLVAALDSDVEDSVLTCECEVLDTHIVGERVEICDPVLIEGTVVSQKTVLIAVSDELVHLFQEALLLVVVSDDVAGADVARNLPEGLELGVVGLVHTVAYGLDQIGCHLA